MALEYSKKYMNGDENIVEILKKSKKPILIYGCANHAELVYEYLLKYNLKIEAFVVDSQYFKENSYIKSIPVKDITEYLGKIGHYNIVIGFCDVDKGKFILNNRSLLKTDFYLLWEPFKSYEWNEEYLNKNWLVFQEIYDGLADVHSKNILNELMNAKLNVDGKEMLKLSDGRQYFNELTFCADSTNEIFVDCGAFNGDTILKYIAFTNGIYKKIFAFEPNLENSLQLKEKIYGLSHIEVINKGTWKENDILEFEMNGSASHIVSDGKIKIPVTTIDDVLRNEKVTFIKMDVEGSELESLEVASCTINSNMPKLAICCYHKKSDIINLYQYIKGFNKADMKYQFYLRHHSNSVYETVLYAIPIKQ